MASVSLSRQLRRDLLALTHASSYELLELKPHWKQIECDIRKDWTRQINRIPDDDPMKLSIDLFTPVACANSERMHTRALSYLLSSTSGHDLGNKILIELLNKISTSKKAPSGVLKLLSSKGTTTSVIPEYRYLEQETHRSLGWCDIRIEIPGKMLIVIENKIDAPEGRDSGGNPQLKWYEKHAKNWEKRHKSSKPIKPILIFLTRETQSRKNWTCLSYIDLASALRHVWRKNKQAKARTWLGLYIATIVCGVLKIDPRRADCADLRIYLEGRP